VSPRLAPGRSRGSGTRCWARLTMLGHRSREPYRVYAEEDFWRSAGLAPAVEPSPPALAARRTRRLAGAAMLAGAVGSVAGVVLVELPSQASHVAQVPGRRSTPGEHARPAMLAVVSARPPARRAVARQTRTRHARHARGRRRSFARAIPRSGDLATRANTSRRRELPTVSIGRAVAASRAAASLPAGPARSRPAEFGFER
jgi:hypothetical protein